MSFLVNLKQKHTMSLPWNSCFPFDWGLKNEFCFGLTKESATYPAFNNAFLICVRVTESGSNSMVADLIEKSAVASLIPTSPSRALTTFGSQPSQVIPLMDNCIFWSDLS